MPDLSIFKPLCQELDISINELLEGEKISKDTSINLESNLFKAIDYEHQKKLRKELYYHSFIIIFGIIILIMSMSIIPNSVSFHTWYTIIGTYILLIISSSLIKNIIDKNQNIIYLIIIAVSFFVIFFIMLYTIDFINVIVNNKAPQVNATPCFTAIPNTNDTAIAYDTPLYDVYDCERSNPHNKLLIKFNTNNIENIYKNIDKYCR